MYPPSQETRLSKEQDTSDPPSVLSIGAPVPRKIVNCIQVGEFMDMAELHMGITTTPSFLSDKEPVKTKRHQVMNIIEWVQCYSIYIA